MDHEPDLDAAVDLVTQMMAIPGKSGEESAVAAFVQEKLREAGLDAGDMKFDAAHRRSPYGGQVGNLIVKLPGLAGKPRRLLMAHLDTVPICVGCKPVRQGNRIVSADPATGLGADDRAGAAVVLTAALEILRNKLPHPPLTLLFCVQEEVGLQGSRNLSKGALGNPKLAFNFDGGAASKLTIGATGCYRIAMEIAGVAAHAGVAPQDGVSAITIASLAIARLHEKGLLGKIALGNRTGTSNVGVFQAGDATNVVTPHASLLAEVRSHHPAFRRKMLQAIRDEFERAARSVKNAAGQSGSIRLETRLDYESYKLNKSEPCVKEAARVIRSLNQEPVFAIADGGLDANWMFAHGVPTASMGAGQENIHTVQESLNVDEFHLACRIGLRLATATV